MSAPTKNEHAFIAAYEKYADAIFRYCYFRVYERETAKELVQETFFRAWRHVAEGNEIRQLRAFLYATARHCIIDYHRKRKETSLDALQERGFEPAADGIAQHLQIRLDLDRAVAIMRQLDEPYREAVLLRYVDGLTPREIAEITGDSVNVISVRIHRGITQLRKFLH
ncbi:MAG: sigma-70 family RNA polymerase sigma factor [Patescibacteria group bacterium]|nr:sigma-70 family RNA polymerase sigma factor [Patescibacteria group bacterium]